jgi:Derlin-2/3
MSDQVMEMFWRMPAVARTVSASALVLSLAVHMGLLSGYRVIYHTYYIFKILPELWRVPTSFLLTGSGLSMVFDTYFLYRYLSELEVSNRRFPRREDLIWYLICVCAGILVSLPALAPPLYPCRSTISANPRRKHLIYLPA